MRGETLPTAEVEAKWTEACRAIRTRVLGVANRMRKLTPKQHVKLVAAAH
jgi:hypothetical protein